MIPPKQGSSLFQDSSLNRTPRDNFFISSYKGPNEISQDVPNRAWNLYSLLKISNPKDEPMTCGSRYKIALLNSPEISHLGKTFISPNWWNQFCSNLRWWKEDRWGYPNAKFQTQRSSTFRDTTKTMSCISEEEIGKLGLPVSGASLHCFQKRSTLDSSPWRGPSFYPIRSLKFQVLKISVSLTNPRSSRSGTRTDTSSR